MCKYSWCVNSCVSVYCLQSHLGLCKQAAGTGHAAVQTQWHLPATLQWLWDRRHHHSLGGWESQQTRYWAALLFKMMIIYVEQWLNLWLLLSLERWEAGLESFALHHQGLLHPLPGWSHQWPEPPPVSLPWPAQRWGFCQVLHPSTM